MLFHDYFLPRKHPREKGGYHIRRKVIMIDPAYTTRIKTIHFLFLFFDRNLSLPIDYFQKKKQGKTPYYSSKPLRVYVKFLFQYLVLFDPYLTSVVENFLPTRGIPRPRMQLMYSFPRRPEAFPPPNNTSHVYFSFAGPSPPPHPPFQELNTPLALSKKRGVFFRLRVYGSVGVCVDTSCPGVF